MVKPGWIVILNGAPRSGKSSIVAEVQATFNGVWINLGVDRYMQCTPERYQPGIGLRPGGERPDLEPLVATLYVALYESIAAHSRLGLNVVVDVGHHDAYSRPLNTLYSGAKRLSGLPVLFVGIHCPIESIMDRRRESSSASNSPVYSTAPLPVQMWQQAVHLPGVYDMELDTSKLTSQACAEAIRRRLDEGPAPTAFERIAAGFR